jgi:hypothetical protein
MAQGAEIMSLKDALLQQVMKVVLENKDEYIELAKDALINFVKEIRVPSEKQPALDIVIKELQEIAQSIQRVYNIVHELTELYGHPQIEKKNDK